MSKFDTATTEVLYRITLDGTAETIGDVSTWGEIHFGLGRLTREELSSTFGDLLSDAGVTAEDFPDGSHWIVHEDGYGFVYACSFGDERVYRAALDDYERQWLAFDNAAS